VDPEEIVRNVEGAILREPGGDKIAKIESAGVEESGRMLWFEVEDFGAGEKYGWTVDTQKVIGEVGYRSAAHEIQAVVRELYKRDEGDRSVLEKGISWHGQRLADSGSPGPGDPDLDL